MNRYNGVNISAVANWYGYYTFQLWVVFVLRVMLVIVWVVSEVTFSSLQDMADDARTFFERSEFSIGRLLNLSFRCMDNLPEEVSSTRADLACHQEHASTLS